MTSTAARPATRRVPLRMLGAARDILIGTLLCLTPLTSVIVLGWLTRRMATVTRTRWGEDRPSPGWLFGARGSGLISRGLGGLAANIRAGLLTIAGLAVLTLPFTVVWLGAWWAGWENSFNKGYEQAAIGPLAWVFAAGVAAIVLTHLPFALAHAAAEDRFGAFFELRRIRAVRAAAGWRSLFLALVTVNLSLPFLASRAVPVFVEDIVPGFAEMSADDQAGVAGLLSLMTAGYGFVMLCIVRHMAAVTYANAVARAVRSGDAGLWDGPAPATGGETITGSRASRVLGPLWFMLTAIVWLGLVFLILAGQFINYNWVLWLTHPVFLLPWFG